MLPALITYVTLYTLWTTICCVPNIESTFAPLVVMNRVDFE